jgi:hypothetical protein
VAKFTYDGNIKVWWVTTLTSTTAPSLAEITAGVQLTPFMRSISLPFSGSVVDSGTADSRFNTTTPGTFGGQEASFTGTRDDVTADDDGYTALTRDSIGYLVISWTGGTGADNAIAATDKVDVWKAQVISRQKADYSRNSLAEFTSTFSILTVPSEDVTVAV